MAPPGRIVFVVSQQGVKVAGVWCLVNTRRHATRERVEEWHISQSAVHCVLCFSASMIELSVNWTVNWGKDIKENGREKKLTQP